jgi:hypothetical protein
MPLESLKELMVLIFGKSNDSLKELTFLIFNKSRIEYKAIHDPHCFKPLKNIESFLGQILAEFLTLPTQLRPPKRGWKWGLPDRTLQSEFSRGYGGFI